MLSVQDAFDAVGYFHLALAAALEDGAHPEALYVVYMKLAEIHGNHMPDAELCQVYRDRAQSLKRVLAGEGGGGDGADTEAGQQREQDLGRTDSLNKRNYIFDSIPEDETCELSSAPRTCMRRVDRKIICIDTLIGDAHGKDDHNQHVPDTDAPNLDGCETDTIASQSCSDSTFTESFDTAKEQISDSSSSTDTLLTQNFDADHGTTPQMPAHSTDDIAGHMDARDTDPDIQDEPHTHARADPVPKDVSVTDTQPGADHTETASMKPDLTGSVDDCTETDHPETGDTNTQA